MAAPVALPLVISAIFSLAVGLLVAWWIVKPSDTDGTITPDELVSGSRPANVSVTGTAEVGRGAPRASFTYLDGSTGSLADFAGSTVVHYQGDLAGLAGALILGPRLG